MGDSLRQLAPALFAAVAVGWAPVASATWVEGPLGAEDASFIGELTGDGAGAVVASAGDVDGDLRDDLLIAAPTASTDIFDLQVECGKVYFLFGGDLAGGLDVSVAVAHATFVGLSTGDHLGMAMAALGDIDGDDLDDFAIGAPDHNGVGFDSGEVYVVTSGGDWLEQGGTWSIADVGFRLQGVLAGERAGFALAGAGDVSGDGIPDLVIGAPGGGTPGAQPGYVYVLQADKLIDPDKPLLLADGLPRIVGEEDGDHVGAALAARADLDGDGIDDLVIGAPLADSPGGIVDVGRTYLVFGRIDFDLPVQETYYLATMADTSFDGDEVGQRAGQAVAVAPDLNGDGRPDLVIGAPGDGHGGQDAGAAYVFVDFDNDRAGHIPIASADTVFVGGAGGNLAGTALGVTRDVTGDGLSDLLIGAYNTNDHAIASGTAYLVLGSVMWAGGEIPLPDHAIAFHGVAASDHLGFALAGVGDVNGDDFSDLLVAAPSNDEGGGSLSYPWDGAGKSYLILGHDCRDDDSDGVAAAFCGGGDCDDQDPAVHPGVPEDCFDGVDNDCDGDIDADDTDCVEGDDDDGGDVDGSGDRLGTWGGGGLVCESGTAAQGAALPVPLLLLATALRRLRQAPRR